MNSWTTDSDFGKGPVGQVARDLSGAAEFALGPAAP